MKRAIIGKGGHARELVSLFPFAVETFTSDEFLTKDYHEYEIMIGVGDSFLRKQILAKLPQDVKFFSYIHPSSIVGNRISVGEGSFVGPYCVLSTDISIGKHALLLRGCHVGHDCTVGDFLSMMGGSIINGNCSIDESFYLGTNSSVKEKIQICHNVKVGLNSGVVNDIIIPGTYVGTPTKKIEKAS
jgi:sugar O-acyltransferase (sialic acid O-acetyltransferase NeuD family)